jgi:hypothetical protein
MPRLTVIISVYIVQYECMGHNAVCTCPTNFGFAVSVISYCLKSPWSQLLKYRYLSSRDMTKSVIRPGQIQCVTHGSNMSSEVGLLLGISGRAQPSTFLLGTSMTLSAFHDPFYMKSSVIYKLHVQMLSNLCFIESEYVRTQSSTNISLCCIRIMQESKL